MDMKDKLDKLNIGWYNEITKQMRINDPHFQMAQGSLGLQTNDSTGLFLMADAVPLPAAVAYYDPGTLTRRHQVYNELLHSLYAEGGEQDLSEILGPELFKDWCVYRKNYKNDQHLSQVEIFKAWTDDNVADPAKAARAILCFEEIATTPLNIAMDDWTTEQSATKGLFRYSSTIEAARQAINDGAGVQFTWDSANMDSENHSSFAKTSTNLDILIYHSDSSSDLEKLNEKALSDVFKVDAKIDKYATLLVQPGLWFHSEEWNRAYNNPNDTTKIWNPNAGTGTWTEFFKDPGTQARHIGQQFLVSGYTITITSTVTYTEDEVNQLAQASNMRVWPFYSTSSSSGYKDEFHLNDKSQLVSVHTLPAGVIQIWGAIVDEDCK